MEMTTKRRVRKYFDPKHPISVDVSGCTEEEKKEVQQAFFDVGIKWESGVARFRYLNAELYSNSTAGGTCYGHLMYGTLPRTDSISRQQFLSMVYEAEQQGHVHAHLMAQYAEDAKTTDKPWKDWQIKTVQGTWKDIGFQFIFDENLTYRLKPKTKLVNGIEILDLSFIPENGEDYIVPAVNINFCQNWVANLESAHTAFFIKHGLCYPSTEEGERVAVAHSKALLGVMV